MQIVLHSDDFLLLEYWEKTLEDGYIIVDEIEKLKQVQNSLIIVNYSACSKDIKHITQNNKVIILHRIPDIETAKYVLGLGAQGYGNALMHQHFIINAIATIREGMIWLHPEFTTMLIEGIPKKIENTSSSKLDVLSKREKEVALLLKDGDLYKEIAQKLSITPRTVKAHATKVYQKLHVKDRLGLALYLR